MFKLFWDFFQGVRPSNNVDQTGLSKQMFVEYNINYWFVPPLHPWWANYTTPWISPFLFSYFCCLCTTEIFREHRSQFYFTYTSISLQRSPVSNLDDIFPHKDAVSFKAILHLIYSNGHAGGELRAGFHSYISSGWWPMDGWMDGFNIILEHIR